MLLYFDPYCSKKAKQVVSIRIVIVKCSHFKNIFCRKSYLNYMKCVYGSKESMISRTVSDSVIHFVHSPWYQGHMWNVSTPQTDITVLNLLLNIKITMCKYISDWGHFNLCDLKWFQTFSKRNLNNNNKVAFLEHDNMKNFHYWWKQARSFSTIWVPWILLQLQWWLFCGN